MTNIWIGTSWNFGCMNTGVGSELSRSVKVTSNSLVAKGDLIRVQQGQPNLTVSHCVRLPSLSAILPSSLTEFQILLAEKAMRVLGSKVITSII